MKVKEMRGIVCLLLFSLPFAAAEMAYKFEVQAGPIGPSPLLDVRGKCGNWSLGRVCDPVNKLTKSEYEDLGNRTLEFAANTPCACYERFCLAPQGHHGYHIAVAILDSALPSLYPSPASSLSAVRIGNNGCRSPDRELEGRKLSKQLLEHYSKSFDTNVWLAGKGSYHHDPLQPTFSYCQDGIVILLARTNAYIASGYKLRYMYNQSKADAVAAAARHRFRMGDYAGGLHQIIDDLEAILIKGHKTQPRPGIAIVRC